MRFGIREFIFFIVLLAVPVASFIFVFQPRNNDIAQARSEIEAKQARLDKLDQVVARIDDIGLAIDAGRDSIDLIEAKLPSAQDVEGILEQVWQIARRNQLHVRSVKSERPVPAALYMELPLRVTMEGRFDGFYQFLLELENLPRITRIHQMELKRLDAKSAPTGRGGAPAPAAESAPEAMRSEFTLSIYFESQS